MRSLRSLRSNPLVPRHPAFVGLAFLAASFACSDDSSSGSAIGSGGSSSSGAGAQALAGDAGERGVYADQFLDGLVDGCGPLDYTCDGDVATSCSTGEIVDCAATGATCAAPFGCTICQPGEGSCAGGQARLCNDRGTEWVEFECDELQGMQCNPDGCSGVCSPAELRDGYIGCEYFPTVSPNPVYSGFDFAVAVANTSDQVADVVVTRGGAETARESVPAGALRVIPLPWVEELKGGDQDSCQQPPAAPASRIVADGAYRLRSTHPVSVYQFNPLQYTLDPTPESCPLRNDCPGAPPRPDEGCLSFSNDATLLFPSNVLSGNYGWIGWPSTSAGVAFASVVATQPNTTVTLGDTAAWTAGTALSGDTGSQLLQPGDVMQLVAAAPAAGSFGADPSGTLFTADKPVQVIAGNSCGFIPDPNTNACDHLEHALLPSETLGTDYLLTFPAAPASQSPQVVKVVALHEGTTLTLDRDVGVGWTERTASPEDGVILLGSVSEDFRISADQPISVAHFLQGQASVDSGAGDPSMAVAVPRAQYRNDYIFSVSNTYDRNYVNVVAPLDATVVLDGQTLSGFRSIGDTGYGVLRHQLSSEQEVFHIQGSDPFGIVVYGYGRFTSYLYPGGLDLRRIAPAVIR